MVSDLEEEAALAEGWSFSVLERVNVDLELHICLDKRRELLSDSDRNDRKIMTKKYRTLASSLLSSLRNKVRVGKRNLVHVRKAACMDLETSALDCLKREIFEVKRMVTRAGLTVDIIFH